VAWGRPAAIYSKPETEIEEKDERKDITGVLEKNIMRSFKMFTVHLIRMTKIIRMRELGTEPSTGRGEIRRKF
jgi:hypothetical protein